MPLNGYVIRLQTHLWGLGMGKRRETIDGKLQCKTCGVWKDIQTGFRINKQGNCNSYCIPCENLRRKIWNVNHKERDRECHHLNYLRNKEAAIKRSSEFYHCNRDRILAHRRRRGWELKLRVIQAYGGCCICCGETIPEFLTVDHIDNDGAEDRRKHRGSHSGSNFYKRLERLRFPKDKYQLLCWNCNCGKAYYGACPHQEKIDHG
jgi:hypothetical protein